MPFPVRCAAKLAHLIEQVSEENTAKPPLAAIAKLRKSCTLQNALHCMARCPCAAKTIVLTQLLLAADFYL